VLFPDFYSTLRRYRLLIAIGTALCVLATLLATSREQKLYSAGAVVRVIPGGADSSANQQYEASQRLARSYAEVYTRGAVSQRIDQMLHLKRPVADKELVAKEVKDLDLLLVGATTSDPRRSAAIANSGWRALDQLSTGERLVLIDPAATPDSPSSPNLKLNVALALVAGLILMTGLALILNAIQRPIPEREAIERDFELPVLAVMPRLPLRGRRDDGPRRRPHEDGGDLQPEDELLAPADEPASTVARSRSRV
jgi:capsular polysaccharide biosynthesis protein